MKKSFFTLLAFLMLCAGEAAASQTGGGTLPYETWLMNLQRSLTGPVAFSVAIIGIVSCGATLIFAGGEISRFLRSLIYIIFVMSLLIGANTLMTRFFNGAVISDAKAPGPEASALGSPERAELDAFLCERGREEC